LANKKLRSDKARNKAMIDLGVRPDTDFVALVLAAREKLGGPGWWQDESGWKDKLQRFAAAAGITPKAPAKKKQEPELISSAEVKTSADQLAFAKQQRAAARSAGDTTGEQAWADLQRDLRGHGRQAPKPNGTLRGHRLRPVAAPLWSQGWCRSGSR
jgi:hypothetical protein